MAPAMAALSLAGSREQFSMWLLQNVGIEGNDFTVNEARATARNGDALLCSLAGQVCTPAGRRRSSGGRGGHGEGQRALRSRGASMFGEVSGVSLFYTPLPFSVELNTYGASLTCQVPRTYHAGSGVVRADKAGEAFTRQVVCRGWPGLLALR